MAPVKKPPHQRQKHYLKEWREFRGVTQESAAERAEISRSLLSKIENGGVPYNQDLLERLALAYGCSPGDLVSLDPSTEPDFAIGDLPRGDRDRVRDFIKALRVTREREAEPTTAAGPSPASRVKPTRSRQSAK